MSENTDKNTTEEIELVGEQFQKVVEKRMDDYEGGKDPKKLARYFCQVLNSTAHEKKYSIVRANPHFKKVNDLVAKVLNSDKTELSITALMNLIENFCKNGRCECVGVSVLRDYKDKIKEKLVDNLPEELKDLPIMLMNLCNTINTIKQNPAYFAWTEEQAKEYISFVIDKPEKWILAF